MQLQEYLYKLSKADLISILSQLADQHSVVDDFLLEKMASEQHDVVQLSKSKSLATGSNEFTLDNHNTISRTSSPQEKINLYKLLFVGRYDVFSLRWYNTKTGKSGYSPVCSNKWLAGKCDIKKYSCSNCPYKSPVRLDDNYIFKHLAGRDEFCRDVIGLYPLMEGNDCRFLAIDFDGHGIKTDQTWKEDILAVHKTCADFSLPNYMEISRSGNGVHLWVFFSEKISAHLARKLGSTLIKAAMRKRHSISFESFDRFFPNQDVIPNGGYGNLIALPLQGRAVKEKHSVFVDENFKPYEDQWSFLSSVQTINEKTVKKAIEAIEGEISDFIEKDESTIVESGKATSTESSDKLCKENLSKKDFQRKVKITLSNYIEIEKVGISEKALGILRRTAVFLNPEYFKNLKMHLPLYNIPRFIDCSRENEKYLLLPRGNLNQVIEELKTANTEYEIIDNRETGNKIDAVFSSALYDEQKDALNSMTKFDTGILSAGTGFGKTVVAAALIAERKTSTLILVQSHTLLEQWKKAVKKFLNFGVGTIAAGKDKSNGIIDVAIVNSLMEKKSDEVKLRAHKYGMLIVDECHHVSAFSTENLVASFKAKYVYGLTATPIRRDGHQKIIFYQCGQILYSTTAKQMNKTQSFVHYFIPRFSSFHYVQDVEEINKKNPSINDYYEKLITNEARNQLIVDDVKNAVATGRIPMILSDRIEHLQILKEQLNSYAEEVILLTGRGTQKQKREILEKLNSVSKSKSLIILATGKYAGEGFDFPRIDTLMLAMPFSWKGTLAQYCGRLHRNVEGKEEVQIFDYVDFRIPVLDRMYQNRLKGYKQLGYSIKPDYCATPNNKDDTLSRLYSTEDYKSDFEKDITNSKTRIIVTAPYISKYETQNFVLMTSKLLVNGVSIQIFIRSATEERKLKKLNTCINLLDKAGIKVIQKENITQKLAVIDEKILWYGNINFLGFTEDEECAIRLLNSVIASEIEGKIVSD